MARFVSVRIKIMFRVSTSFRIWKMINLAYF